MSEEERDDRDEKIRKAETEQAKNSREGERSSGAVAGRSIESTRGDERAHNGSSGERRPLRGKRILKWVLFIVGLFFFLAVLREAMDPFGDDPYVPISHGDHVHYVPEDRDPNVPIGRFPTTEPAADERITPDGRVVKKE